VKRSSGRIISVNDFLTYIFSYKIVRSFFNYYVLLIESFYVGFGYVVVIIISFHLHLSNQLLQRFPWHFFRGSDYNACKCSCHQLFTTVSGNSFRLVRGSLTCVINVIVNAYSKQGLSFRSHPKD